jgi:three-Cys-motif partner protein
MASKKLHIDEIGPWSEVKLDILQRYATEYSKILSNQESPSLYHCYIDAFAGPGKHYSKTQDKMVLGSPINALLVKPPFREFFLIDLDGEKIEELRRAIGPRDDVHLHRGDCNTVLLQDVFPKVQYGDFRRGLCILDPYRLNLTWDVIKSAGDMKSIDLFINFPIMDINRNVLRRDAESVKKTDIERMNAFWGDESWRHLVYSTTGHLFGDPEKVADNDEVAEAFRERLKRVAGFKRVPKPLAMKNKRKATVYYLFFASQKGTAETIVQFIFDKYGKWEV